MAAKRTPTKANNPDRWTLPPLTRRTREPDRMSGTQTGTLADLKEALAARQAAAAEAAATGQPIPTPPSDAPKREPKRDALGRSYATGRRKESVARVWIKPGKGEITVN